MAALGRLLDENHALCQELTVSCKELDDLVVAARGAGAYKPPDDVHMLSDQRLALRASFEAFAGPTASYGMRPE